MKYPKYKLAFPGKHVIVFKGHPMTQFGGYTLGTYASGNGIVSANKTKGFWGESAELFQSAADYYTFAGYSANKGTVNGNTYIFGKGDDIVTAFFNETEIYNLFLNQTQGGTITGIPMSGHSGQYIVLSALPSSYYTFNGYSVTGGVLSGDKIIIGNSDMTAQANWIQDPVRNIVLVQVSGGKISSDKATAYDGDIVLFSYTPSANYVFNGYDITGSVLSGNSALVNNSNITAKGKFLYNDPGEDYESIDICDQTWMKYNLNVDDGRGGVVKTHSGYGGYDFGEQYFYTPEAAYRIGNSIRGWRVPSWGDVSALRSCAGGVSAGYNLKSTFGWYNQSVLSHPPGNGCDKYGFRALPVGNYVHNIVTDTYHFDGVGCDTTFICGPSSWETPAWWWTFQGNDGQMGVVNNGYRYSSLRLIKKPKHTITLNQTSGGVIMANMLTAYSDDEIVLTNQALPGWAFSNYSVTGATLTGNRFIMPENDVTAQGNFIEHPERQVIIQQTTGGTLWVNPENGFDGDTVTLSNTPSSHYTFGSYSITGATLTGSQFKFSGSNVTAKANFIEDPKRTVTVTQTSGGTVNASPTVGYDGTTVTLSNTPNTNYTLRNYSITGATLTGNKFNLNGSNVTVKGNFFKDDIPTADQVKIGSQTWTNKDLRYKPTGVVWYDTISSYDSYSNLTITDYYSAYYDPSDLRTSGVVSINRTNNTAGYGYTYWMAVKAAEQIESWHLPSSAEWNTLRNYAGGTNVAGKKLKSTAWNGTDQYGMSLNPNNYRTSTRFTTDASYVFYARGGYDTLWSDWVSNNMLANIRLIKDT